MGKQQSKWTFLALQYLGLGAKKLGRLLSARATAHEMKKAPSQRASPPLLQCKGGGFDSHEGAFSACMWAPRNNNQNGETTIKMDFLGTAIFGAGRQEIRAPSQCTRNH